MLKALFAIPVGAVIFLLISAFFSDVYEQAELTRTEAVTEAGLTCSTGVGEASCSVTASQVHAFVDAGAGATVTETSPGSGDRTADATLGSDGLTWTVSNLDPSTNYEFTIDHLVVDSDIPSWTAELLHQFPVMWLLGGVVVLVAGIIAGIAILGSR